jgi:DUF3047 family protein
MKINIQDNKNKLFISLIITVTFLFLIIASVQNITAKDVVLVGDFSCSSSCVLLPDQWEPLTFDKISKHTQYTVIDDNHNPVIKAVSNQSASGLIRKIRINPEQYPIIKWRWKITTTYQNGDVTKKRGDDYPARIYITFKYDPEKATFFEWAKFKAAKIIYGEYTPQAAINYIWASKAPKGTLVVNPYTDNLQMFVIQSGEKKINTWIEEERNIYQDYIRAFGKKPPMISGIAIMTDSDDTGEQAVSYYGDIVMESIK